MDPVSKLGNIASNPCECIVLANRTAKFQVTRHNFNFWEPAFPGTWNTWFQLGKIGSNLWRPAVPRICSPRLQNFNAWYQRLKPLFPKNIQKCNALMPISENRPILESDTHGSEYNLSNAVLGNGPRVKTRKHSFQPASKLGTFFLLGKSVPIFGDPRFLELAIRGYKTSKHVYQRLGPVIPKCETL